MKSLGLRRRLLLVIVAAVTVALVGLVAGFNLIVGNVLERSADNLARSRVAAQLETVRVQNGRVTFVEAPDDRAADAYLWVFSGARPVEQPRTGPEIAHAARSLVRGPARFLDVPKTDTRLYAAPVVDHDRRVGTVVAGVSLTAYEQTRKLALLASLVLGGLVLILVVVAARWLLGAALRPVGRMTRQAAEWSEHDLEHRFGLGPPHDELTELAATLDGLLDRVASSLRRERRFSAELSHELRTPLTRVLAESELALRRVREPEEYRRALDSIHRSADQLSRTVDALVAAARYESGGERGTADARAVADSVARAWGGGAAPRGVWFYHSAVSY
jgi:two-component system OmpR family sensor kinase